MHLETLAEFIPREGYKIIMDNINGGKTSLKRLRFSSEKRGSMKHISEPRILTIAAVFLAVIIVVVGCATSAPLHTEASTRAADKEPETLRERCPDRDRDGVCDADDRCPTSIGTSATLGCPIEPCSSSPLVVIVQFEYDSTALPSMGDDVEKMDPVLDAVGDAIEQDPSCRVCIVGHASEEGPAEYNQVLSSRRASAVKDYLTIRGLAEAQMLTTGLGERCRLVPESTHALNRRVEFRRLKEGASCPIDCSR